MIPCSCGRSFPSMAHLIRHRMRQAHCADCGVAVDDAEPGVADAGLCLCVACEHLRECNGCAASAHRFNREHARVQP